MDVRSTCQTFRILNCRARAYPYSFFIFWGRWGWSQSREELKIPEHWSDKVIGLQRMPLILFTAGITGWKFSLVQSFVLYNLRRSCTFFSSCVFVTSVGFQLIIDIPHWNSNKSLENQMLTFPIKCSLSFQHFFLRNKKSKKRKSKANYVWMSQTENTAISRKSTFLWSHSLDFQQHAHMIPWAVIWLLPPT